jgi:hypothetical protein
MRRADLLDMKNFTSPKNGPSAKGCIVSIREGKPTELQYSHGGEEKFIFTPTHQSPDRCDYYGYFQDGRVALVRIVCGEIIHLYFEA